MPRQLDSADGLVVAAMPHVSLRVWWQQYFIPIFIEEKLKLRGELVYNKSYCLMWVHAGLKSG